MRHVKPCLGKTLYCIALSLCFTGTVVGAQSRMASTEVSPTSVIQEYCRLDSEGARLSSQNPLSDKISAMVTWPIEPGWDTIVVVGNFEVVGSHSGPRKSSVTVRYTVLGNMFGAKVTASQQHKELVTFTLTKSKDGWRIVRPLIAPHVSVAAATSVLNSLLVDEKDPEQIKRLHAGIDVLTKWKHEAASSKVP
jgi:hypothetical protein